MLPLPNMDLRYSVTQPPAGPDETLHRWYNVCTVSTESVVAFSRVAGQSTENGTRIIHSVAVADLNCPYHSSDIVQCSEPIILLQFSYDGKQLLVITEGGNIRLYEQVSGALQPDWSLVAETTIKGETVIAAAFLHNGQKPQINLGEVKVNSLYSEKFSLQNHAASLVAPGNCPVNGVLAVTCSGLVVAMAVWHPGVVEVKKKVLGHTRGHYTAADIAMAPDGRVVVCAWQANVVRCFHLTLQHAHLAPPDANDNTTFIGEDKLVLRVQSGENVCPTRPGEARGKDTADSLAHKELSADSYRVSEVFFPQHEDPTVLLLVLVLHRQHSASGADSAGDAKGGQRSLNIHIVQKYRLEEQTVPPCKLFKLDSSSASSNAASKHKVWSLVGEWQPTNGSAVTSLATCQRPLFAATSHHMPPHLPHIVSVATVNSDDATSINTINLHTMMAVGCYKLSSMRGAGSGGSAEEELLAVGGAGRRVSLAHTWTGLSLFAYDTRGSMYFFSLIKPVDIGNLWPLCVLLLLEYSLVSGHDCWELLINTPPSSVTTVVDRLMDTLSLHHASLQKLNHTKMFLLRHAILRLSPNSPPRACEARLQAQLSAILAHYRQMRPLTNEADKSLTQLLTGYLEQRNSLEQLDLDKSIDQFLFSAGQLVDCQVEQREGRYLQPMLQYTAELSLYLLCTMAQANKNEVLRETATVQMAREVLMRGRLLHRHNKLVFPHIARKTDSVDVWAQLYRLLTRLLAALPGEPDASFMDEVVLLETQVLVCHVPLLLPSRGFLSGMHGPPSTIAATQPHQTNAPQQYTHCEEDAPPPALAPPPLDGALAAANPRDPLFLQHIPAYAPKLQCSRCWCVRVSHHDPGSAWEQRWAARCVCSGHWTPNPLLLAPQSIPHPGPPPIHVI